jgi:hypothetical protein
MKAHTTASRTGLSARLAALGCGIVALLASAVISACTTSPSASLPPSSSPSGSSPATAPESPTPTVTTPTAPDTGTGSPSVAPVSPTTPAPAATTPTPTVSPTFAPASVAPATGGGGTAGFQGTLILVLGAAAIVAGAVGLAYRRRAIRNR